ncbi:MAG: putative sugar O-methyltransferase [Actinobacteria bacterium]|nr:putative sugar O-methyltransferase [Actinomycetota bacterium]
MRAAQQTTERPADIWTGIASRQGTLVRILSTRDPQALAEYLDHAPEHPVLQGVLQDDIETGMLRRSGQYRRLKSQIAVDRFVSLMECIGSLAVQNPEQGPWGTRRELDGQTLLRDLDRYCGVEVVVPQVFRGLFVVEIAGRLFNTVDLMAINSALKIRKILAGSARKSLLEIGAGSGRTAYWCLRFGLGPIGIIDLPHVAIAQAWYLAKAMPEVGLQLYGETSNADAMVSIYPDFALAQVPAEPLGLVFNQDSFPEMSKSAVIQYLDWIAASDARLLLSINHESGAATAFGTQLNFSALATTAGYVSIERQRNWIRRGYVDELFSVSRRPRKLGV